MDDSEHTNPDDELIEVYCAAQHQAEFVHGILESEDIVSFIRGGGLSGAYPVSVGAMGETRVFVRRGDIEKAREVIEAAERGDYALSEDELPEGLEEEPDG